LSYKRNMGYILAYFYFLCKYYSQIFVLPHLQVIKKG